MSRRLWKAALLRALRTASCRKEAGSDLLSRDPIPQRPAVLFGSSQREHAGLGATQKALTRRFSSASQGERRAGPVSYTSLALTAATGAGLLYWFQHAQKEKLKEAVLKSESVGKAAIGGPFALLDQDGRPFSDKDLLGEFALLYFGFTYCPDICPDELEKMAEAVDAVELEAGRKIQPVFISIDPERDDVRQVKEYVSEFHPRLVGLTGTTEQVTNAARQYRVYYTKTSESEDYLVDHSIIMYLIDPHGDFVTFYGKNFTAKQLAESVADYVRRWSYSAAAGLPDGRR